MRTIKFLLFVSLLFGFTAFLANSAWATSTDISGDATSSSFTFAGPISVSSLSVVDSFQFTGSSINFNNAILKAVGAGVLANDAVRFSQLKILQVLMISTNTLASTTSTSFVDTSLSGTITPSTTSSKILIMVSGTVRHHNSVGWNIYFTLYRATTNLGDGNNGFGRMVITNTDGIIPCAFNYLDSPNSTSAQTYKVAIRTDGSPAGVDWGITGTQVMILMEVNGL